MTLSGVQPTGGMDVDHAQANGGTFDATLHVRPIFTFTKVDPPPLGGVGVLDTVLEGIPAFDLETLASEPWVHTMLPEDMHYAAGVSAGDFYPGVTPPVIFAETGSQSQLVYNAATPEPATLGLLLIGSLALLLRRRLG